MINSELLKEAIADAKAVRVTAYANAKASLQERFDKRFEAVFAEKLKNEAQEEEEQEEGVNEVEAPNQVSGKGGEAKGPKTKAVSKGQPKKVSDASTNYKTVAVGGSEGAAGSKAPAADDTIMETAEEEDEAKMDEQYEEEEEGKMDEAGFTSEDLDEIIKELEAEVAGEEEGQHVEEPADLPPSPEHGQEPGEPEGEPHDEIPGEPGEEPHDEEPHGGEPHGEPDGDEIPQAPEGGEGEVPVDINAEPGSEVEVGPEAGAMPPHAAPPVPPVPGAEGQEEISLEELLAALNEEADEEEEEEEDESKMDEITNHGLPKNVDGQDKTGGTNTYPKGPDASKRQLPGKNHNIMGKGKIAKGTVGGKPLSESELGKYKQALKESYKTIEFLRGQINEVNLLNAKLLYTNKLFKEFATVIDEPYRMKIVEAFDLTKSVREVKLAYALLAESLNFGSKRVIAPARSTLKVDPARRAIVKQITEGQASRPVASTKPAPSVLTENADYMVNRFQKLAGIKKPIVEAKK